MAKDKPSAMHRPCVDPGLFRALLIAAPFGIAFYALLCAIILAFGPAIRAGLL